MPSIAIVAGEASGDASGAALAIELKKACPEIEIWGAGGQRMKEAGVELVADFSWVGAIGILESLKMAPRLLGEFNRLKKEFVARQPDVFVPIDFGAFNVKLGSFARAEGIRTVYYFPPGSWRRSPRDPSRLLAAADKIITPFPWSAEFLSQSGADAVFLGHPMLDRVAPTMSREQYLQKIEVNSDSKTVGLLPGSRSHEIENILPVMLGAAVEISRSMSDIDTFAIGVGSDRAEYLIDKTIKKWQKQNQGLVPRFVKVRNLTYDVMAHSELLITCSGTATLESMILGTPMIIVYRGSKAMQFEFLFRKGVLENFIGMPNIIAGREICPELLGDKASPEAMSRLAIEFLGQPEKIQDAKQALADAKAILGDAGATRKAAEAILETIRV